LSLRGFASTLFYHPIIASDGEHAVTQSQVFKICIAKKSR